MEEFEGDSSVPVGRLDADHAQARTRHRFAAIQTIAITVSMWPTQVRKTAITMVLVMFVTSIVTMMVSATHWMFAKTLTMP